MKAVLRFIYAGQVGLLQALLLALLLGCIVSSEMGALTLLLGWPILTWRRWRKPARPPARGPARAQGEQPAAARPTAARGAIAPLVLAPIVLSVPVFFLVAALDRGAGGSGIVTIVTVVIMSSVFLYCWGAALVALLFHLSRR